MKQRDQKIVRAVLESLDLIDGQLTETILHAEVNLRVTPNALLSEFENALKYCDFKKWVIGVRPEFGPAKWLISDLGRAKKAELE
jgi:hypothetical protein